MNGFRSHITKATLTWKPKNISWLEGKRGQEDFSCFQKFTRKDVPDDQ